MQCEDEALKMFKGIKEEIKKAKGELKLNQRKAGYLRI